MIPDPASLKSLLSEDLTSHGISLSTFSQMTMHSDLSATIALLDQAKDLAKSLDDAAWTQPNEAFRGSTLGQHVRHVLDHIETLLGGLKDGAVNYDVRMRDKSVETSTGTAFSRCETLQNTLTQAGELYAPNHTLGIKASCSDTNDITETASSFGRELQFIVSHTVHHYAIIGAYCHSLGVPTPENFGVAPSTVKHRAASAA